MGLPGFAPPEIPEGTRRLLVLSPFLSAPFLKEIAEAALTVLISRAESLDAIEAATLKKFDKIFAIDDSASGNDEASETTEMPAPTALNRPLERHRRNRGRFPGGRGSQNLKNVIQAAGDFAAA